MNKVGYFILGAMTVLGMYFLMGVSFATELKWGVCESIGPQCNTDDGVQTRNVKEYANPICPVLYELKNSGNWNQRCHRLFHWQKPEHKAPVGCPEGFLQDGAKCSKVIVEEQSCQTGELRYDACEEVGQCQTECGLEASEVPNGQGGYIQCEATPACEEPEEEVVEERESTPSERTFHKDTRCHDKTPPAITWINGEDGSTSNNFMPLFTWSAEGGDKIQFRFSEDAGDLRWTFVEPNDGHETMGTIENSGTLGQVYYFWQARTINGCKKGPWTDTFKVFN